MMPHKVLPLPRPLQLAARSAMALGVVLSIIGVIYLGVAFWGAREYGNQANGTLVIVILTIAAALIFGVGVLFVLASIFVRRRKFWAIILAMVLTSLSLLMIAGQVAQNALRGATFGAIPTLIVLLFAAAFAQMLWHLIAGLRALRNDPLTARGFTPLMAQPVTPERKEG